MTFQRNPYFSLGVLDAKKCGISIPALCVRQRNVSDGVEAEERQKARIQPRAHAVHVVRDGRVTADVTTDSACGVCPSRPVDMNQWVNNNGRAVFE